MSNLPNYLLYNGTDIPVMLGDYVCIKRLFRRPLYGRVGYIPGVSSVDERLEEDGRRHWAIVLDNNNGVMTMFYSPEHLQVPKKIVFMNRGPIIVIGDFF